jgi:hypothetical protein
MKRTGEFRNGKMCSVRLNAEEAREARWASDESGTPVSELLRQGLRPVPRAWRRPSRYRDVRLRLRSQPRGDLVFHPASIPPCESIGGRRCLGCRRVV